MAKRQRAMVGVCVVAATSVWLVAGPLNPPEGPVQSGGKTTQEIYDAVTGVSNSLGVVGGRGPAVPGADRGAGSLSITGSRPVSGPILGLRFSGVRPPATGTGSGGTASVYRVQSFTVVRELGVGSASAFRLTSAAQAAPTAVIRVPAAGGDMVYTLSTVTVVGQRQYHIQRADGTFASIEELDLNFDQIAVAAPDGTSTHNLLNGSGT